MKFFCGQGVNRPLRSTIVRHDLGIPTSIFSCGEGNADRRLELLCPRTDLVLALIITVATILGKMIGCGVGVYRLGVKPAVGVGMGMIPGGEVMIIVALIDLRQHSISDSAGQEFITVVTALPALPIVGALFWARRERSRRQHRKQH